MFGRRALLLAALLSCLPACTGPQPARIICGQCEEGDRFVRLQQRDGALDRDHPADHPFLLAQQDWRPILGSLRVQSLKEAFPLLTSKGEAAEAFTEEEIAYLSETLAKAFAKAGPDDWVLFALVRKSSPDISELTSGAWYMEGGRVHVLLANYRFPATMPGVRDLLWDQPLYAYPAFYAVAPGEFQSVTRRHGLGGRIVSAGVPDVAIDVKPLLLAQRPQLRPAESDPAAARPSKPATPASVEESLESLKRWRERGLITEEEYQAKKKELLGRF
jgi:hypothetical protein